MATNYLIICVQLFKNIFSTKKKKKKIKPNPYLA